jgi:transposase
MDRASLEALDRASLVDLALRQGSQITELEARLLALEERFGGLERQAARAAAPFGRSEDKLSKSPRKPGRKPGHEGSYRVRPVDEAIDQWIDAPLERCPCCGEQLESATDRVMEQTIIEVPPVRPQLIRLTLHSNKCCYCRRRVVSHHPLQVSRACGAAGTHLGARALALVAGLNKGFGLTMRKTCAVLSELVGTRLTPGGLAQALARMAGRVKQDEKALLAAVKGQAVLHTDETSWWVGGSGFSLWVLTNQAGTYYQIVPSRSKAQAEELLGGYKGVLISDCLNIYDDLTPRQHKCYAHHLKQISKGLEEARGASASYLRELRALLQAAMALKAEQANLPADKVARMRQTLEVRADHLLGPPRGQDENGQDRVDDKLRLRLAKQRDHLFVFLDHEGVEATNNLAERQLRPAVISRKLSCGNKTMHGAATWQTLTSLAATCHQRHQSFIDFLVPKLALQPQNTR